MVFLLQIFKTRLFNDFFVQQCSVLRNDSALPNMEYKTVVRKSSVSITEDQIVKIIRKLSSNKSHRCDNMSIRMLKICDTAIAEPLKLIYEKCLDTGRYPRLWKKAIIVSAQKKNSRQILKNTGPFRSFQSVEKFLQKSFLTKFMSISLRTNFFWINSQVFALVTHH